MKRPLFLCVPSKSRRRMEEGVGQFRKSAAGVRAGFFAERAGRPDCRGGSQ